VESLRAQTDRSFAFVVIDGASSDGTQHVIAEASDIVTFTSSEQDEDFYDALNKGLHAVGTDYYLVVGADDVLRPDAIANFKSAARNTNADVIVAAVEVGKTVLRGYRPHRAWLGHAAMVTSHSVGMLFRTQLHKNFGDYPRRYAILADGYFIKRVCTAQGVKVVEGDFVAGRFATGGISKNNIVRVLCKYWQIQLDTGENRFVQYLMFQFLLLRYLPRILAKSGRAVK
jgi:glycosyltransferase involved in cell wall biosynthesis